MHIRVENFSKYFLHGFFLNCLERDAYISGIYVNASALAMCRLCNHGHESSSPPLLKIANVVHTYKCAKIGQQQNTFLCSLSLTVNAYFYALLMQKGQNNYCGRPGLHFFKVTGHTLVAIFIFAIDFLLEFRGLFG